MTSWPSTLSTHARAMKLVPAATRLILGGPPRRENEVQAFGRAVTVVLELLADLPSRLDVSDLRQFAYRLGFSKAETAIMLMRGVPSLDSRAFFRVDAVFTDNGFKIIEINAGTTASGTTMVLGSLPMILGEKQPGNPLDAWVRFMSTRVAAGSTGVVVDNASRGSLYRRYSGLMVDRMRRARHCSVLHAHSRRLSWNGEELATGRLGVRWAYPICFPSHILNAPTDYAALVAACSGGAVDLPVDFSTRILGGKAGLALLHTLLDRRMLSEAEADAVRRYVPPTYILTTENEAWAVRTRDQLTLKPSVGSSGVGVLIGADVEASTWKQAIDRGVSSGVVHVLQKTCEAKIEPCIVAAGGVPPKEVAGRFVWGFFSAGGRPCGEPMLRFKELAGSRVINHANGAAIGPLPPC